MNNSQNGQSKKRSFDEFNSVRQRDADMLFNSDQNNGNPNFIPDQQDDFEAREDNDVLLQEDEDVNGSDEGEGDDLEENLDGDYAQVAELDNYEAAGLDDQD